MRVELRRRRTPPVRGSWFAHVEGLRGAPLARVEGLVSILSITAQYALRAMADRCVYGGSFTEVEHGENLASDAEQQIVAPFGCPRSRWQRTDNIRAALVHGSESRADSPVPRAGSRHSVAVRHPETGHRVEDLARQLYLNSLSSEGSTSHPSTDDRLVTVHGVVHHAALAVA